MRISQMDIIWRPDAVVMSFLSGIVRCAAMPGCIDCQAEFSFSKARRMWDLAVPFFSDIPLSSSDIFGAALPYDDLFL